MAAMFQVNRPNQMDKPLNPDTGLYVGDLEEGVTVEQLFLEFRNHGQLQYIRLFRYPFIGKSRHFAFVYFSTQEEALKAKEALNYKRLLKQPVRITTLKDYEPEGNLFFAGFTQDTQLREVESFFARWGNVISVQFSYDEKKVSRGYGWVQFEKKESAEQLQSELQDGKIQFRENYPIMVKRFIKKGGDNREDKRNNLYIKNFWTSLDNYNLEDANVKKELESQMKEKINEWFKDYGTIISIYVSINTQRKQPFAFISFENNNQAKVAFKALGQDGRKDPLTTGRPMYVGWAQNSKDRKKTREGNVTDRYIFMHGLKNDVTESALREALSECGEISVVRLDKLNIHFHPIMRIGYLVFDQAADSNRLMKTYKENEKLKPLFEQGEVNFKFLFPPSYIQRQIKSQQRNRRVSPTRHMMHSSPPPPAFGAMPPPFFMMPPQGQMPMPFPNQPGPMYPPRMGGGAPGPYNQHRGRDRSGPHQQHRGPYGGQPGFNPQHMYQPVNPNQQPRQQYVAPRHDQTNQAAVPYERKQDLLDLLNNLETFKRQPEAAQRNQLGQMLLVRIKNKLNQLSQKQHSRIVGMLIDEESFSIEEILHLLKNEKDFDEQLKEAVETLEQAEQEEN